MDIDEITGIILLFAVIILLFTVCIYKMIQDAKESEKQERKKQEKEEKEEERKLKSKCAICSKCSMGNFLCDNCIERAKPIAKELPKYKVKNFESVSNFRSELMEKIIKEKSQYQKEFFCLQLLAVTDILTNKYHIESASQETKDFLIKKDQSIENNEEITTEDYIQILINEKKFSNSNEDPDLEDKEFISEDFRDKFKKPYRCQDGDYVRSKSEREIDNFLFQNRIWHIYEYTYEHPITKETALPDFYLPDYNLFIEYFGLKTPEYIEKRNHKIKMYKNDTSINFEYLTFEDDNNIYEKLKEISKKYNISIK